MVEGLRGVWVLGVEAELAARLVEELLEGALVEVERMA